MASESKLHDKIQKGEQKLAEYRKKVKELGEERKGSVPGVAIIGGKFLAVAAAAAAGMGDARLGTAKNQHPTSIVTTVVGTLGAIGAAVTGHTIAAELAADVALGPLCGLAWGKGRDAGLEQKPAPAAAG
jgi:hypothetical protein